VERNAEQGGDKEVVESLGRRVGDGGLSYGVGCARLGVPGDGDESPTTNLMAMNLMAMNLTAMNR
jgi:hypothetical protein